MQLNYYCFFMLKKIMYSLVFSREGCCYNHSLFTLHGVVILEDLVITLADGISSVYLELISVDGNVSNEMNSLGWSYCTLSTRALQRLRNEVVVFFFGKLLVMVVDIYVPLVPWTLLCFLSLSFSLSLFHGTKIFLAFKGFILC